MSKSHKLQVTGHKLRSTLITAIILNFMIPSSAFADTDISAVEKPFLEGKYDKAERAAQSMIDQRSRQRYEVYYLKGLSELKLNKFKEARESFGAIISKYPGSNRVFDANLGIGDSYMLEGNTQEAVKVYNDIAMRFPRDKNIAIVKERLDDCRKGSAKAADAIETVSESSDLKPNTIPKNESRGYISVQAGCFKNRRNAEALAKKLSGRGYESYVELPMGSDANLFRVKVGRLASQEEAQDLAAKLHRDGYNTKICDASE